MQLTELTEREYKLSKIKTTRTAVIYQRSLTVYLRVFMNYKTLYDGSHNVGCCQTTISDHSRPLSSPVNELISGPSVVSPAR
jgi:hypothetical protein